MVVAMRVGSGSALWAQVRRLPPPLTARLRFHDWGRDDRAATHHVKRIVFGFVQAARRFELGCSLLVVVVLTVASHGGGACAA